MTLWAATLTMHVGSLLVGALVAALTAAHPGHDISQEAKERREFLLNHRNDLDHCAEHLQASGVHSRNIERRSEIANGLTMGQGLQG